VSVSHIRLLAACLALCAGCAPDKAEPLPPGTAVLVLGDSLSAGYGLTPAQAWPAHLAERTGWRVINAGVSGDKSRDALARLPALLDAHAPRLVLVELGGNDMLHRLPEAQTRADLARILDQIRARGSLAVLLATPRPSLAGAVFQSLSAAPFYAELAKEARVPLIEDALARVLSDPALKLDALHPNADGQALLAGMVQQDLRRLGFAR